MRVTTKKEAMKGVWHGRWCWSDSEADHTEYLLEMRKRKPAERISFFAWQAEVLAEERYFLELDRDGLT